MTDMLTEQRPRPVLLDPMEIPAEKNLDNLSLNELRELKSSSDIDLVSIIGQWRAAMSATDEWERTHGLPVRSNSRENTERQLLEDLATEKGLDSSYIIAFWSLLVQDYGKGIEQPQDTGENEFAQLDVASDEQPEQTHEEVLTYRGECAKAFIDAIGQRQTITDAIGLQKLKAGQPVQVHSEETRVVTEISEVASRLGLAPRLVIPLWLGLMRESRKRQDLQRKNLCSIPVATSVQLDTIAVRPPTTSLRLHTRIRDINSPYFV